MMKKLESPPSGEELKEIRLSYDLTQKQLGEILGVTGLIVYFYETGRIQFPEEHLEKLNRLLSASPGSAPTDSAAGTFVPPPAPEQPEQSPEPGSSSSSTPSPEEIKALRLERGLRLKDVADAFGKSLESISAYEHGRVRVPPGLAECIKGIKDPDAAFPPSPSPEEIKALRVERGLRLREVAEAFGKSECSICSYEHGRATVPPGLAECIKGMADPLPAPDYEIGPPVSPEELLALFPEECEARMTCEEFAAYRILNGLTRTEFAAEVGSTDSSIGFYERGQLRVPKELERRIKELYPDLDVAPYVARVQALDITPSRPASPVMFLMLRLSRGLSRAALASAIGKSEHTIERYENGKISVPYEVVFRVLMMYPEETGMKLSGRDLKDLRLSLGLTRNVFALKFGTTRNVVSDYENGQSDPPEWLVKKIAQSKKLRTDRST